MQGNFLNENSKFISNNHAEFYTYHKGILMNQNILDLNSSCEPTRTDSFTSGLLLEFIYVMGGENRDSVVSDDFKFIFEYC